MQLVARRRRRGVRDTRSAARRVHPRPRRVDRGAQDAARLGRQPYRWHRGLVDVLRRYHGVALRPRYGSFGLVAYPGFLLTDVLPPVLEVVPSWRADQVPARKGQSWAR